MEQLFSELDSWRSNENKIFKTFKFESFEKSIAFANSVANLSEKENHHPEIYINFKKVKLTYTSHDLNCLSVKDFICAAKVDFKIYKSLV